MAEDTSFPYLTDIVDAIERVRGLLGNMPLETFEADWEKQWAIERGVEIISEASRRLLPKIKARHPEILWRKVAGIGNVLRHDSATSCAMIMRASPHLSCGNWSGRIFPSSIRCAATNWRG